MRTFLIPFLVLLLAAGATAALGSEYGVSNTRPANEYKEYTLKTQKFMTDDCTGTATTTTNTKRTVPNSLSKARAESAGFQSADDDDYSSTILSTITTTDTTYTVCVPKSCSNEKLPDYLTTEESKAEFRKSMCDTQGYYYKLVTGARYPNSNPCAWVQTTITGLEQYPNTGERRPTFEEPQETFYSDNKCTKDEQKAPTPAPAPTPPAPATTAPTPNPQLVVASADASWKDEPSFCLKDCVEPTTEGALSCKAQLDAKKRAASSTLYTCTSPASALQPVTWLTALCALFVMRM